MKTTTQNQDTGEWLETEFQRVGSKWKIGKYTFKCTNYEDGTFTMELSPMQRAEKNCPWATVQYFTSSDLFYLGAKEV